MIQIFSTPLLGALRRLSSPALPLALSLMSVLGLAVAEPTQKPLGSRTAPPPSVNLMLTIDDSASMLFDFMPEGYFRVNGQQVRIGFSTVDANGTTIDHSWPTGFPGDKWRTGSALSGSNWSSGYVPADKSDTNAFPKQYRSPDVNALYYNPDKVYRPWISASDPTKEMAPGVFSRALFDPRFSDTFRDLRTATSQNRTWCYTTSCNTDATRTFHSALVYRLISATANPNNASSYVRYDLNARGGDTWAPAVKHPNRTDCADTRCTQAEEQQNFANWFTYHRTRIAIFKGALGRSLVNYQDKVRVGWAIFNQVNGHVSTSSNIQQGVKQMDLMTLKDTLAGLYNIDPDRSTPSRKVLDVIGQYFQGTGTDSPWRNSATDSTQLSCRRSANFFMTDGYYNDNDYTAAGNVDGSAGPDYSPAYPAGSGGATQYKAVKPYSDSKSNTLADVALKYYKADLQTGIPNKIVPVQGDIAYWQHLTQYMVGLGVKGVLDASTPAAKEATLAAITAGTLAWPDPTPPDALAPRIDDMWHAAVNTGGDFYSVSDSDGLKAAIAESLGKATGGEAKEAGVAVSSESVVTGSLKLVPRYDSQSWTGGLDAYTLKVDGSQDTKAWSAKTPTWDQRNLFTWSGVVPEAFVYSTLSSDNKTTMQSESLTNWVRGDTSNEDAADPYRARGRQPFGDFVNSPPVFVKEPLNLGYGDLDSSYDTYQTSKASRGSGVVFLGGNDGIVHAFDAGASANKGTEIFGFLPQAGLGKLSSIAKKDYGSDANPHKFVVDGWVFETDAYIKNRRNTLPEWSNLVVGSMGAGGRGLFALHVPTALGSSPALDVDTVLWELSSADPAYGSSIGYVMGKVAVGKIQGGSLSDGWKVFVGNGVDSSEGKASLLVVDLSTGKVDKEIVVDSGGGNGLMGVSLIKGPKNVVIGAYAGDLKGNVWRFDFGSATDSATWKVSFKSKPLVRVGQAITAAPTPVVRTGATGRVVTFGTGRLIMESDASSATVESVYGVLDPTSLYESAEDATSPLEAETNVRSKLEPRTVSWETTAVEGVYYATITGDAIDWVTKSGWYADLPNSGERTLLAPMLLVGKYVLLQTMVPGPDPVACVPSYGKGYAYIIDSITGKNVAEPIFDTDKSGKVDDDDANYAGYYKDGENKVDGTRDVVITDAVGGGGEGQPPKCKAEKGYKRVFIASTASTGMWVCLPDPEEGPPVDPCDPKNKEVACSLAPSDRVWRQILNPPQ